MDEIRRSHLYIVIFLLFIAVFSFCLSTDGYVNFVRNPYGKMITSMGLGLLGFYISILVFSLLKGKI